MKTKTGKASSGMSKHQQGILRLFWTAQQAKELPRQGILLAGFRLHQIDTVAAHSWTVSVLAYLLARDLVTRHPAVSPAAVLEMAVLHDLGESLTGDIGRYVKWKAKEAWDVVEKEAFEELDKAINPDGVPVLWPIVDGYNSRSSAQAWVVKVADPLDAAAQTERAGSNSAGLTRNDRKLLRDLKEAATAKRTAGRGAEAAMLLDLRRFFAESCKRIRNGEVKRIRL